jgi:hypothetical protein
MDHVAGPLHIFCLAEKEGRIWFSIICFQLYQFERSTWWCLSVLESILQSVPKFVLLEKIFKKVIVSRNLCLTKIPGDHKTLSINRHVGLHVEVFFGPLGLHLRVWSELGRSLPFWPTRALRLQWSRSFSHVCEVALSATHVISDKSIPDA